MTLYLPYPFEAVVFDFDGTLVLSNHIKIESYLQLASIFNGGIDKMSELLSTRPPIGDRYKILHDFAMYAVSRQTCTDLDIGRLYEFLCSQFTLYTFKKICVAEPRKGSVQILRRLNENGIKTFLISATPEECLMPIIRKIGWTDFFLETHGGPHNKHENLSIISNKYGIEKDRFIIIGDGQDDYDYAYAANCGFIGVSGGTLESNKSNMLTNFDCLPETIQYCTQFRIN
jgi:phosphoglycolate phosphatase